MLQPPSGRYDEQKKVGTWTGPARGFDVEKYQSLANQPYVIDCEGNTETNLGVPTEQWSVGPDSESTPDGKFYQYFLGDTETVLNYYKSNDPSTGITLSKLQTLSPEEQGKYCDVPSEDGIYYLLEVAEYPREVSIDIYANIWFPETAEDLVTELVCPPAGKLIARYTVTGDTTGAVYGRGPYADISNFNTAAVHAGLVQNRETAVIDVKSAGPDPIPEYQGATFNGVTSLPLAATVGGVILQVALEDDGQLGEGEITVTPGVTNGDGAGFFVELNPDGSVKNVNIVAGGVNYTIGDKFRITTPDQTREATFVVSAITQATTGGICGVNLDLNSDLTNINISSTCQPERYTSKMTVDGTNAKLRGAINGIKVLNPYANPTKVFNSLSQSEFDWNWYYSCPPGDSTTGPLEKVNQYFFKQISGASLDEQHEAANFSYQWTAYNNQLTGCCPATGCGTANRVNWKVDKVSVAFGGNNYAVGDRFVLTQKETSPGIDDGFENNEVILEVTNIMGDIDGPGTIQYTVEKDVQLVYIDPDLDVIIDQVIDVFVESTTDEVLQLSTNQTMGLFLGTLGRSPSELEFQYYTRLFYAEGGDLTEEIQKQFDQTYKTYLTMDAGKLLKVLSSCDRIQDDPTDDLSQGTTTSSAFTLGEIINLNRARNLEAQTVTFAAPRAAASGTADPSSGTCLYRRNVFWQGDSLNNLWNFLGKPKGPSTSGGGTTANNIVCPKPAGLQDNEPDFSDFAGMELWRWKDCGLGTGLDAIGSYEVVYAPCPGSEGAEVESRAETKSDAYAVYSVGNTITYNDGSVVDEDLNGNPLDLVISTKDSTAAAINDQYQNILQRPAEQEGMKYWYEDANRTAEDDIAVYYAGARMKFADGFEFTGNFVQQTKNSTADAINATYMAEFGRPAEQAGLQYWYAEALATSLEQTITNIKIAGQPEKDRGGVTEFCFGLCRTLEHIAYAAQPELSRGFPASIDTATTTDRLTDSPIDLSWFRDTALPNPQAISLLTGPPDIEPDLSTFGQKRYFKANPSNQTIFYGVYGSATSVVEKPNIVNKFNITWPTIQGGVLPRNFAIMRIVETRIIWETDSSDDAGNSVTLYAYNIDGDLFAGDWVKDYWPELGANANQGEKIYQPTTGVDSGIVDAKWLCYLDGDVGSGTMGQNILWDYDANRTLDQTARFVSEGQNPNKVSNIRTAIVAKSILFSYSGSDSNPTDLQPYDQRIETYDPNPDYANRYVYVAGCEKKQCPDGSFVCVDSSCPTDPCPEGYKTCPDGTRVCKDETCPTSSCNPRTTCGDFQNIQINTGDYQDLTFSFTTGMASCQTQGTAVVSILRYWPCPTFGPTPPMANQWIVQKTPVAVRDGKAEYVLKNINTDKRDYLAGDDKYGEPGNCHWVYVAYWEFQHPNFTCQYDKWGNPGCNFGYGNNQLDEILCVQQQNCNDPNGDPLANAGTAQDCIDQNSLLNGFEDNDIDPLSCLPYCDTASAGTFYWIDENQIPKPGDNCVNRNGDPGSVTTDPEECTNDCPVCEQSIKVTIADATLCGPTSAPQMIEGTNPGINSGRFKVGFTVPYIDEPNFTPVVVSKEVATYAPVCNESDYLSAEAMTMPCVSVNLDAWVNLPSVRFDTEVTLGVDNAVDFTTGSDEDYDALYRDCCESYDASFKCVNFVQDQGCYKYEEGLFETEKDQADCDAKVIVVGHWYYKTRFKNGTEQPIVPLPQYDAQGQETFLVDPEIYPISAGNNSSAFPLSYLQEEGSNSYFRSLAGGINRTIPYVESVDTVEIFLQIKASNDHFGNVIYDNPPLGFNSNDFGTDTTISSPRPPWNIGTQGPGPKDTIFAVGKFKISDSQDLPQLDGWEAVIEGCGDAQVYEPYNYREFGLACGEPGSPTYYECFLQNNLKYFQENWYDPETDTRKSDSFAFTCSPEERAPAGCAPPSSDVVLSVGSNPPNSGFPVDWGTNVPGQCLGGLKIMWYVDGVVRSRGFVDDGKTGTGDGGYYYAYDLFNCDSTDPDWFTTPNQKTRDLSQFFTDPNKDYKVEMYLIANGFTQFVAHSAPESGETPLATKIGIHRGDRRRPINIIDDIQEGEFYQVIVGYDTCTIRGNSGPPTDGPSKVITDFDSPVVNIQGLLNTNIIFGPYLQGTLTARVTNLPDGWPTNPVTNQKIVGSISYFWEVRGDQFEQNQWSPVEGGTGDSIAYTADGTYYRCTVTLDTRDATNIPPGYVVSPQTKSTTQQFIATENATTQCADGTFVLEGEECPENGICGQPQLVTSSPFLYVLNGDARENRVAVGKGETVRVYIEASYSGFSNRKLKWYSAKAQVYDASEIPEVNLGNRTVYEEVSLNASVDPNLHESDVVTFTNYLDITSDVDLITFLHCRISIDFECLDDVYTPDPGTTPPPGTPDNPVQPGPDLSPDVSVIER